MHTKLSTSKLMQEGDLDSLVKAQNGVLLDEDSVLLKFVQICLGLQHVHSKVISCPESSIAKLMTASEDSITPREKEIEIIHVPCP